MYKILHLPHTADVRIKVEADTLEELFLGCAKSISNLLKPKFCEGDPNYTILHSIEVNSREMTTLLIDFLSEILTLSHMEKVIFCEFDIEFLMDNCIKANLKGKPVIGFEEDVKAITYHEAEVIKNEKEKWETLIIVDI